MNTAHLSERQNHNNILLLRLSAGWDLSSPPSSSSSFQTVAAGSKDAETCAPQAKLRVSFQPSNQESYLLYPLSKRSKQEQQQPPNFWNERESFDYTSAEKPKHLLAIFAFRSLPFWALLVRSYFFEHSRPDEI